MKRRNFMQLTGASLLLGSKMSMPVAAAEAAAGTASIQEPARQIPVVESADVVVCGGGPAGVTAAIAAARKGAKTTLIETGGCLGGIWTAGLLCWILDYTNKPGMMQEYLKRLKERDGAALNAKGGVTGSCDVEAMKLLLEDLCAEAGVNIHLHTRVCAAQRGAEGRLGHVITESKSGREAFAGKVFIDATGDGDLAAQAGCGFDFGHPETQLTQPMSMICLLTGLDRHAIAEYYRDEDSPVSWAAPKDKLRAEMERGGHSPSYAKPSLFRVRDDLFIMMANHEYNVKGISEREVTAATLRSRREVNQLIDGLRSLGGVWKNARVVATAEQIGVREGRRIHGLYTLTADDLREGRQFPDAVCRVTFGIDVHATDAKKGKGIEKSTFKAKPYDVPLRALISKDIDNLMMAGRCISGDFIAHSSYRVTGNSVAMGEAAGNAAAVAVKGKKMPKDVGIGELA